MQIPDRFSLPQNPHSFLVSVSNEIPGISQAVTTHVHQIPVESRSWFINLVLELRRAQLVILKCPRTRLVQGTQSISG